MMLELIVMFCVFANDHTTDLECTVVKTRTEDCAKTLAVLRDANQDKMLRTMECVRLDE